MQNDELLRELQGDFISEARELLDKVEGFFLTLEKEPTDPETLQQIFNVAHNIKGSGKAVGFDQLSGFAHKVENLLVAVRQGQCAIGPSTVSLLLACCDAMQLDLQTLSKDPTAHLDHQALEAQLEATVQGGGSVSPSSPTLVGLTRPDAPPRQHQAPALAEQPSEPVPPPPGNQRLTQKSSSKNGGSSDEFVRIPVQKIDTLLNNLGEQVILQSMLDQSKFDLIANADFVTRTITQLNKLTYELQQTAITLRMVNLKTLFSKLERAGRDAAQLLGKTIDFEFNGAEQELDKSIVEALADPLTHMIRNSVDHGIEDAADRLIAGKPERGQISISALRKGGAVLIEVVDDGKGLDPERILKKAQAQGLVAADAKLSTPEIFELIFENGLSTRDSASELSGRGVGMNVVKETILGLRGVCKIDSELGRGTRFSIRLPLTLAIFNGLVVRVDDRRYIVPASEVQEVTALKSHRIRATERGSAVVCVREEIFPLVDLSSELHRSAPQLPKTASHGTLLLTRNGMNRCALRVDEVLAQQKVVHKTFEQTARPMRGVGGATILGDGSVALILELGTFMPELRAS